ncbi:peptidase G1 [Butyriboletus roseoflavus]|nr:peptidase G1 [Butyriboletus roseoflavus]
MHIHISLFASRTAWYEWYPDTSNLFSQSLNISAGDEIKLSVIIFSLTSGVATVENLTNGQVASRPLNSSTPLCLQDVAWMVEDYTSNGVPVPLTNFSTVTFTNAVATGIQIRYPAGANTSDINQNGQVLTNTTIHGKSLSIQYI